MKRKVLKSLLLSAGVVAISGSVFAQSYSGMVLPVKDGKVAANLKSKMIAQTDVSKNLAGMLGLSSQNTFVSVSETKDKLGFTHVTYQQYFQGILVQNGKVMVHYKDGVVNTINASVAPIATMSVSASVSKDEAVTFAKNYLNVTRFINTYPVSLVIDKVTGADQKLSYTLSYKVRIDGKTATGNTVMQNVFVDANSGRVYKALNLIHDADVTATAHTLYSGNRTIVTDSTATGFRLRDSARNIATYDVAGCDQDSVGNQVFLSPKDYMNATTDWDVKPALMTMRLSTAPSSMTTGLGFQSGNFLSSFVYRGNPSNDIMATWPSVNISQSTSATLPIFARNIYLFPTDTNYVAGFAKINIFNGTVSDTAYFNLSNITTGIYNWSTANATGTYEIKSQKNPGLDAHWGMEMTHDFYNQILSRNSYDGNGSLVKNFVNGIYPTSFTQNNAAALPSPYFSMVYGMGDGQVYDAFVGLDVMGHEFTHMVTESNGNGGLDYSGESGALNESFSDVFGTSVEFFAKGADEANWTIGEDMSYTGGILRSMSNPKVEQNPDTYLGQYWVSTANPNQNNDNGGVHYNSGIQNKWFYLLSVGGTGTNDNSYAYNVTGIGIAKAQQIAYRNLTTYILPDAQYIDAYHGSLQATLDLYGNDTTAAEYVAVKAAWFAVGIPTQVDTTTQPTAIHDIKVNQNDLTIYPNPATKQVTISSAIDQVLDAQILNAVGVPVLSIKVGKGLNNVDISALAKGIYMIRYNTGAKGYVQKLSVF